MTKTEKIELGILVPIWAPLLLAFLAPTTPVTLRVLSFGLVLALGIPIVVILLRYVPITGLILAMVMMVSPGVVWWWWVHSHIPAEVEQARERVHELQARMEVDKLCSVISESGQTLWFRLQNDIDRQFIYEEDLLADGHKLRIYRYGDTVAIEKPGMVYEYLQEYYRNGYVFAYDSLDESRRPKWLWYKGQYIAPSTIEFWGDPAPFEGKSPPLNPCKAPASAQGTPTTPSILPLPIPAIGYR